MESKLFGCLEQKIIDILWQSDVPLKPSEVLRKLDGKHAYTTIMTVLKRMADKKVLSREMVGKAFVYKPVANKEKYIKNSLTDIYGSLMNTYGELAISQFVDIVNTNKSDMDILKLYLEQKQFSDTKKK